MLIVVELVPLVLRMVKSFQGKIKIHKIIVEDGGCMPMNESTVQGEENVGSANYGRLSYEVVGTAKI